jgi:hypothetical protein
MHITISNRTKACGHLLKPALGPGLPPDSLDMELSTGEFVSFTVAEVRAIAQAARQSKSEPFREAWRSPYAGEDPERERQIIELAQERWDGGSGHYSDGDINLDDNAIISDNDDPNENGCYVEAWVWVRFDGTPLDKTATAPAVPATTVGPKPE